MAGGLVFYLKPGATIVGSDSQKADIVSKGLGILDVHAKLMLDEEKKTVTLTLPEETLAKGGKVVVNGKIVSERMTAIEPGDRIIFGRNFMTRLYYDDKAPIKPLGVDAEESTEIMQAELAVANGKAASAEEYLKKQKTIGWLMHADDVIDEANEIAQTLQRKITYGMDIVEEKKTVVVKVNSFEESATQEWTLDELENEKLPQMRLVLKDYLENGIVLDAPEIDPFFDPPQDEKVGECGMTMARVFVDGITEKTLVMRREVEDEELDALDSSDNENPFDSAEGTASSSSSSSSSDNSTAEEEKIKAKAKGIEYGRVDVVMQLQMRKAPVPSTKDPKKLVKQPIIAIPRKEKTAQMEEEIKAKTELALPASSAESSSSSASASASASSSSSSSSSSSNASKTSKGSSGGKNKYETSETEQRRKRRGTEGDDSVSSTSTHDAVDLEAVIGNTLVLTIDVKGMQLSPFVQTTSGVFVRFQSPLETEVITKRTEIAEEVEVQLNKLEKMKAMQEEEKADQIEKTKESECTGDSNTQKAEQTEEASEKLKRKRTVKKYKYSNSEASYTFEIANVTKKDIEHLSSLSIVFEVVGHASSHKQPSTEETAKLVALRQKTAKKRAEKKKAEVELKEREEELKKMKEEMDALASKVTELEKSESSSCVIL
eukprot:MONOS_8883.1-p1 / transcript=MONOS_8883.1 / gene=MONOS_8883 / organism=Monocercomonoides_exilis_PA203 / gene_product=unspecified product / transcript_product=unspecified product / location=Mono_scaffold00348:44116-46098(-) / protein_length=661 / sequence_SO=supercontig / SO=protein_coding / is_pseudo=false